MSNEWFEIGPRDQSPCLGEPAEREPPKHEGEGLTLQTRRYRVHEHIPDLRSPRRGVVVEPGRVVP